ncbi:MAG TPA: hypothetical protein VMT90_06785 [Dehalococcoidia bacterium]|jgi:hypothetical protein|nr:hypothetical protein [Dehalococcoidia bacterium]
MATSTRETATNRLFDSVIERQAAIYDALRSATDRYHRFNRSVLEGYRQSTADWTEVGRRWLTNPTDVLGVYEAASEALGNGQARTLALAREWLEDRLEAQRETRESFRKGFGDVREAVERARADAPEFFRRGFRRGTANGREEKAAKEA